MSLGFEWTYPMINPVVLDLPGPFAVRWYGLMYLVGFGIGFYLLHRLARQGRLMLPPDRVGEVIGYAALGVLVGGRLGYLLFYNPGALLRPMEIIAIWEGGLSFHGGLIGIVLLLVWYGRRNGVPFLALGDMIVLAAPPGIAAVRLANFVNGELYGRVAGEGVPWAMRFPTDPVARRLLGLEYAGPDAVYRATRAARLESQWDRIAEQIPLRHPSQLYEAALEGVGVFLLLWAVVWAARRWGWRLRTGTFGAIFLVAYAISRIFAEQFRQPDGQFVSPDNPLGTVLGPLTMGQVLSLGLLAGGLLLGALILAGRVPDRPADSLREPGGRAARS